MAGIRGVAETYQQVSAISHQMRATSHSLVSKSIDRTARLYDQKVDNTHWQQSSGLSLCMQYPQRNGAVDNAAHRSIEVSERLKFSILFSMDTISTTTRNQKEDHTLSMTRAQLDNRHGCFDGRNVTQLMQQEIASSIFAAKTSGTEFKRKIS
jgi:hypothetical protein